ncbi:hypothetical protein CSPAE12_07896 [Colletotrichum incanum]|nr:hypothetical protein CSPAE12_07896 [Colletotrichum incanum]
MDSRAAVTVPAGKQRQPARSSPLGRPDNSQRYQPASIGDQLILNELSKAADEVCQSENVMTPEQVEILKKAAQEQALGVRKAGVATFDDGLKKPNQRM